MKLERYAEAREELQRALAMTDNIREQNLLSKKVHQAIALADAHPRNVLDR